MRIDFSTIRFAPQMAAEAFTKATKHLGDFVKSAIHKVGQLYESIRYSSKTLQPRPVVCVGPSKELLEQNKADVKREVEGYVTSTLNQKIQENLAKVNKMEEHINTLKQKYQGQNQLGEFMIQKQQRTLESVKLKHSILVALKDKLPTIETKDQLEGVFTIMKNTEL